MTRCYLCILLLFSFLSVSCQVTYKKAPFAVSLAAPSKVEEPKKVENHSGYWVSKENGQVIEVMGNGGVILNRFGTMVPEIIEADEAKINFIHDTKIRLVSKDEVNDYHKALSISVNELTGKWFAYKNEGSYESSHFLTYEVDGYHIDKIELFHDDDSYSQYSQFNEYRFSQGFVFEEYHEESESYWYFLIESTDEHMTYIDEDGTIWREEKYVGQEHVNIPRHYFNESF